MGSRPRSLPLLADGLTMTDAARELTYRLGRLVEPHQVHYLAVRRGAVPVGRTRVTKLVEDDVYAVAPSNLDALEAAYREQYVDDAGRAG